MTSLRELKKDINYLCSEFVGDCYLLMHFHPEHEGLIEEFASKVLKAREGLINIISHPENKNRRNISKNSELLKQRRKNHKDSINNAFDFFIKQIEDGYEELKKLSK